MELITIEDPLLRPNSYQLLPIATSQLVGNNSEFDVSGIFLPILLIVGGGELITIEDPSLSAHVSQDLTFLYSVQSLYQSSRMMRWAFHPIVCGGHN